MIQSYLEGELPPAAERSGAAMQFLFFVDFVYEDLPGGSRVVAREQAKRLVQRGHEVTLLAARRTPEAPAAEVREGILIVRYGGAGNAARFVWQGRQACARLMAANRYDMVVTHFAYAALGPMQAVKKTTPQLRIFHGPWDLESWAEDQAGLLALPDLGPQEAAAAPEKRSQACCTRLDREFKPAAEPEGDCSQPLHGGGRDGTRIDGERGGRRSWRHPC